MVLKNNIKELDEYINKAFLLGSFDELHRYDGRFLRYHGKEVKEQLKYEWDEFVKENG